MAEWNDPRTTGVNTAATVGVPRAARDVGLRSYMLSVYNYMASGVLLTGIVAMLFANSSLINLVATANPATGAVQPSGLGWIVIFAPLAGVTVSVRPPIALTVKELPLTAVTNPPPRTIPLTSTVSSVTISLSLDGSGRWPGWNWLRSILPCTVTT